MNVNKAQTYMEVSMTDIEQAWRFSLAAVTLMCMELLLPCLVGCFASCCAGIFLSNRAVEKQNVLIDDQVTSDYNYAGVQNNNSYDYSADKKPLLDEKPPVIGNPDMPPQQNYGQPSMPPQQPQYGVP
jgi:hypothetical protein